MKSSVIIDTDPGSDDALAIVFAHHAPELEVQGLTTVFGNQTVERTTRNALATRDILGVTTPVYQGASRPLVKPLMPQLRSRSASGDYGATGLFENAPETAAGAAKDVMGFFASAIKPGVRIACLGPTTNLALVANLYPEVLCQASEIVIMGGAFNHCGNEGPWAELNVYSDPDALAQLLAFERVPKVLVPLEVCLSVPVVVEDFASVKEQKLARWLRGVTQAYNEGFTDQHSYGSSSKSSPMYDAVVVAYLLWGDDLFDVKEAHVVVETGDGPARGATATRDMEEENLLSNCRLVTSGERFPLGCNAMEVKRRLIQLLS